MSPKVIKGRKTRLRVGFISSDLTNHIVGHGIASLLALWRAQHQVSTPVCVGVCVCVCVHQVSTPQSPSLRTETPSPKPGEGTPTPSSQRHPSRRNPDALKDKLTRAHVDDRACACGCSVEALGRAALVLGEALVRDLGANASAGHPSVLVERWF
jgi:hypothetical protein